MGTRADFYIGRGPKAEWLGSIAVDGYRRGVKPLLGLHSEHAFRAAVAEFLDVRPDHTFPADGWPWPWNDSATTDWAYAFDKGRVFASNFGGAWFNAMLRTSADKRRAPAVFPDMSSIKQREKFGAHSGLLILGAP
jgi:hypothetical protein